MPSIGGAIFFAQFLGSRATRPDRGPMPLIESARTLFENATALLGNATALLGKYSVHLSDRRLPGNLVGARHCPASELASQREVPGLQTPAQAAKFHMNRNVRKRQLEAVTKKVSPGIVGRRARGPMASRRFKARGGRERKR